MDASWREAAVDRLISLWNRIAGQVGSLFAIARKMERSLKNTLPFQQGPDRYYGQARELDALELYARARFFGCSCLA